MRLNNHLVSLNKRVSPARYISPDLSCQTTLNNNAGSGTQFTQEGKNFSTRIK